MKLSKPSAETLERTTSTVRKALTTQECDLVPQIPVRFLENFLPSRKIRKLPSLQAQATSGRSVCASPQQLIMARHPINTGAWTEFDKRGFLNPNRVSGSNR